jgi:hypothetical protein
MRSVMPLARISASIPRSAFPTANRSSFTNGPARAYAHSDAEFR